MPIKLDKAIEISDTFQCDLPRNEIPDLIDSIKLGIEGLKAIRDFRQGLVVDFELPLPNEQPEEIEKGG